MAHVRNIPAGRIHARRVHFYDHPIGAVLVLVLVAVALNLALPALRMKLDDWRYGYPRTTHLSAAVGHEDQPGRPTKFIAANLDRQIVVFEIPGGDVTKTRTLAGPYLFGANEDLTPVRIRLELINGDQLPDLVVSVKREEVIYINDTGNYRLITDAEKAELEDRR